MQAAIYLAAAGDGQEFVPIRQIGEDLSISPPFLAKVLRPITERGLLRSQRGPGGGVALNRPPHRITLKEIVLAIDGPELFEKCVLGLPGCGNQKPCPLHDEWGDTRAGLTAVFEEVTVALLAESSDQGNGKVELFPTW